MKTIIAAILLALFVTGCTAPPPQAPKDANYGQVPEDYRDLVVNYLQDRLGVSEDADIHFGTPRTAVVNQNLSYGGRLQWTGYGVNVFVTHEAPKAGERETKYVALLRNDLGTNRVLLVEREDDARFLVRYTDEVAE